MPENKQKTGLVFMLSNRDARQSPQHETATRIFVAQRLAALKGYGFGGEYQPSSSEYRCCYLVPVDTLVGIENARALGITSEADFFGGLVPQPFMATKSITHPLLYDGAAAPECWCSDFGRRVQGVVLSGFSAFTIEDAHRACTRMLEHGAVRLKPALAVGGKQQRVVSEKAEMEAALDALDPAELSAYGVVIEENLRDVTTYSVGTVQLDHFRITYCGTQRLTLDHRNEKVYGGSDLLVARGGFEQLLQLKISSEMELAVAQARVYDHAASTDIRGFLASRRNYDVAFGIDARGRRRGGVLEQSWRIGGASPAEVAALEAFCQNPDLAFVRACCPEIYDAEHEPPPNSQISFRGEDSEVGSVTKYSLVERYDHAR